MAKIDIRRPHGKSLPEARAVVEKVATRMSEKLGTTGGWQGDAYTFSGSGVKGAITVSDTDVHVAVELGMMLSAVRGMVESEIRKKLDEHFA
ncbi:polyhydroxyalkanoic acid system family protein [Luteibacter sp. PPL201]|uniref:Polyhydroxyalkanoic acid system family protein n=1 Tax=Luteibacter sahnii TaxID=3021977 RepID=A0ABT6B808_9GAMM|nr:polyhydroxyalkanoic acid system family protein [Luteibacter sp. PPL193]MDY1547961.1 polyhydroxyalkanoic acid system family protein [Luteibacter sp. PPL193]